MKIMKMNYYGKRLWRNGGEWNFGVMDLEIFQQSITPLFQKIIL
ncbi:MAG: hypothetical protein WAR59_07390 [Ignavibacteriaceae bacterium]